MKHVFKLIFDKAVKSEIFNQNIQDHFKKIEPNTLIPMLDVYQSPLKEKSPDYRMWELTGKRIPTDVSGTLIFLEISKIDDNPIFMLDLFDPLKLYENLKENDIYYYIENTIKKTFEPVDKYIQFNVKLVPKLDDVISLNEKQSCNFKFPKEIYDSLKDLSELQHLNMTDYIIQLILKESKNLTSGYMKVNDIHNSMHTKTIYDQIPLIPAGGILNLVPLNTLPETASVGDIIRLKDCHDKNPKLRTSKSYDDGLYIYTNDESFYSQSPWKPIITW